MRYAIKNHAADVLRYAFKHDHPEVMDEAAPLTVDEPVDNLIASWESTPGILVVWTKYHRQWLDALDFAHKQYIYPKDHLSYTGGCDQKGLWETNRTHVACFLGADPGKLRNLQAAFGPQEKPLEKCYGCKCQLQNWLIAVQKRVNELPKFSTLL
jgi:hypothetical protein